jgi:hypothetical protein
MNSTAFNFQQQIAYFLIDQLESKKISIKRAAEIAKQVLYILPENENPHINLEKVKEQLIAIPELSKLDFKII